MITVRRASAALAATGLIVAIGGAVAAAAPASQDGCRTLMSKTYVETRQATADGLPGVQHRTVTVSVQKCHFSGAWGPVEVSK